MLTTPTPLPPNSMSPLPANWGQQNARSIYSLFSAGLMQEPQIACAPGPAAFMDISLNLAAQVAQVQQTMQQGLTTNNAQLGAAAESAGQSGASSSPSDFSGAAQVFPMGTTATMVLEKIPLQQRIKRKGPPRNTNSPGVPWGGAAVSYPPGGCSAQQGLSGWAQLFLVAGAGALIFAVAHNSR